MTERPSPETTLRGLRDSADDWPEIVRRVGLRFGAETVTIHRLDPMTRTLTLIASSPGLGAELFAIIATIPLGKGMAGVAALERRPVATCDLQVDAGTGAIRKGAVQSGMRGAVVVPIEAPDGARVLGTLGVGTAREHEFAADEVADLERFARTLGLLLASG